MKEYQLTPLEIEHLKERGHELAEIDHAKRVVYSYEDWLDPNRSMGLFELGGWGIEARYLSEKGDSTTKENGELTLFILPESEGQKIEQRKSGIVEGFVIAYTDALIGWFESRHSESKEKVLLIRKELEKLEKLLFQWKEHFVYATFGDEFWLRFDTTGYKKQGTMCDWYERVCIDGMDAKMAVSGHDSTLTAKELSQNPDTLHFVVAALAFERFKKYLNAKLVEQEQPAPVGTPLSNKEKPIIKDGYCCPYTLEIMQNLVERYNVTQIEVRHFENFFVQHPYTNLDLGNVYRDKTTEDLDFEKLLSKIFEVANLFEGDIRDYFFACVDEDGERKNKHRIGETDWYILKKKIAERRNSTASAVPTVQKGKVVPKRDLPTFEEAVKEPEKLPGLWKKLSETDNAFVNENGKIKGGRKARKHREVMALAQLISKLVKDGYGQFEVYSMLCKKLGLDESERSDKIPNRPGYDDIRLMLLTELKDLLK